MGAHRTRCCSSCSPSRASGPWSRADVLTSELADKYLMQTGRRLPVTFVRGQGCLVYDDAGNEYLDLVAGIAVNVLGHAHPDVVAALAGQARTLIHTSNLYYTQPQVELARRLVELSFPSRVFFCNSGAEANESAIKIARKWGALHRDSAFEIITTTGSFHGRTVAAGRHCGRPAQVPRPIQAAARGLRARALQRPRCDQGGDQRPHCRGDARA